MTTMSVIMAYEVQRDARNRAHVPVYVHHRIIGFFVLVLGGVRCLASSWRILIGGVWGLRGRESFNKCRRGGLISGGEFFKVSGVEIWDWKFIGIDVFGNEFRNYIQMKECECL